MTNFTSAMLGMCVCGCLCGYRAMNGECMGECVCVLSVSVCMSMCVCVSECLSECTWMCTNYMMEWVVGVHVCGRWIVWYAWYANHLYLVFQPPTHLRTLPFWLLLRVRWSIWRPSLYIWLVYIGMVYLNEKFYSSSVFGVVFRYLQQKFFSGCSVRVSVIRVTK